jgi:hypothetical protein
MSEFFYMLTKAMTVSIVVNCAKMVSKQWLLISGNDIEQKLQILTNRCLHLNSD